MAQKWQLRSVNGMNGSTHNNVIEWYTGERTHYEWDDQEKTYHFFVKKSLLTDESKADLEDYAKYFRIKISFV